MTRVALPFALLKAAVVLALPAQAAGSLTRTFVSAAGNDANPCTVTQPCRTFAAAYAATAANGIISALDPAGYGSLTITGPVTVDGNGFAAITAPAGGNGITINAGPSDKVTLRGLTMDGAGAGLVGILFASGQSLTVVDCAARNMTSAGLYLHSSVTTAQTLAVSNSSFYDSGNVGIAIDAFSSAVITGSIDRTGFFGNAGFGLILNGLAGTGLSLWR
jgi:hypothetical protein